MVDSTRGVSALLVVGAASLGIGLLISLASFQRAQDAVMQPPGFGDEQPFGLAMLGGLLSVAGLAMLGFWLIGPQARYAARAARPEIAAAIREGMASGALRCASCGTTNPPDAKHCKECGARVAA